MQQIQKHLFGLGSSTLPQGKAPFSAERGIWEDTATWEKWMTMKS